MKPELTEEEMLADLRMKAQQHTERRFNSYRIGVRNEIYGLEGETGKEKKYYQKRLANAIVAWETFASQQNMPIDAEEMASYKSLLK